MSSPDAEVSDTSIQFQSKLILVQSDQGSYIWNISPVLLTSWTKTLDCSNATYSTQPRFKCHWHLPTGFQGKYFTRVTIESLGQSPSMVLQRWPLLWAYLNKCSQSISASLQMYKQLMPHHSNIIGMNNFYSLYKWISNRLKYNM